MGLSLQPARLKRYGEIARLLYKYGRRDLVTRAGLEELLSGEPLESGQVTVSRDGDAAPPLAHWLYFLPAYRQS